MAGSTDTARRNPVALAIKPITTAITGSAMKASGGTMTCIGNSGPLLEPIAQADGRTLLTLDTVTGSSAEPLYRSLGYVEVGVIPRYARGSLTPSLLLSGPEGVDPRTFMDNAAQANRIVHDLVARHGGSFSAEHGVGQLKRDELVRYKSPVELRLMRAVKLALDPLGLMNPGKVL